MAQADCFSPDYATARERFLAAARDCGFRIESHQFAARGAEGEPLFLDGAWLGDSAAERVIVASSGLHGVEGFFGSAVQLAYLMKARANGGPSLPPGTALLFLHALNPFGFAALRRWNENNVDLNRNFLENWSFLETDPEHRESLHIYERLHSFLNPDSPPWRPDTCLIQAILRVLHEGRRARRNMEGPRPGVLDLRRIGELGLGELRKTLPVGQYSHPTGLFFGGTEAEETTRVLREHLPRWLEGSGRVLHVDFHTGLGDRGEYKLILVDREGSERERWWSGHFEARAVEPWGGRGDGKRTAYEARGLMAEYFRRRLVEIEYDCVTAEFGTCSAIRVLCALRAENQAHFYGRRGTTTFALAKARLLETFCPSDPAWREGTVRSGLGIIDRLVAMGSDHQAR